MEAVLVVPRVPDRLELRIEHAWDGTPCDDPSARGVVRLAAAPEGLRVAAGLPHQRAPRIPDAPPGSRVADLWEYDVVECFLVGAGGRYLEVELGAGGHFLVLAFDAPRALGDAHAGLELPLAHSADAAGWRSEALLPWELVPAGLCALGAFAVAGGRFLAHAPLPGSAPDFHQPGAYPRARLAPAPLSRE